MLTLTTPPSALLTIEQLRDHCRVDGTDSDSALLAYLAAAVAYVDGPYGAVGKAIGAQEWTLSRGRVTGTDRVEIPVLPFVSVVSGSYYDAANASQTLDMLNRQRMFCTLSGCLCRIGTKTARRWTAHR